MLNYFLTVAREKTISRAADVLHLSQPTLSKQLKELEEELGVTLFIRGNRSITLTEDGLYLANRGKEILSLVELTTSNLPQNETISGKIMIGVMKQEDLNLSVACYMNSERNIPTLLFNCIAAMQMTF